MKNEMKDEINVSKVLRLLDKQKDFTNKKRRKLATNFLTNENFMKFIWDPYSGNPAEKKVISERIEQMYDGMIKARMLEAFTSAIKHEGAMTFDRNAAAFITAICNQATDNKNKQITDFKKQRQAGELSNTDYNRYMKGANEYQQIIDELRKKGVKIVKKTAKELSDDCDLPIDVCLIALINAPDPKYITRKSLNMYLTNTLNLIYEQVYRSDYRISVSVKTWKKFFKVLYGEDKVLECATIIALEGLNRYNRYKNNNNVKKIWDSLTEFALYYLDQAPEKMREQMMDIYVKKIEQMFRNNSYDLRVDMRNISKVEYPKLFETASKYIDTITGIINKVAK